MALNTFVEHKYIVLKDNTAPFVLPAQAIKSSTKQKISEQNSCLLIEMSYDYYTVVKDSNH